jgi:tripartite-type tricarboxylate transporter receptor subunit TctC
MVFNPKSSLLPHFQESKLKALAVTSAARWPELPKVPTMNELGIAGFPTEVWFGLLAPTGTSTGTIDRLNQAVNEGLKSNEVRPALAKLGIEGKSGAPRISRRLSRNKRGRGAQSSWPLELRRTEYKG